MTEYTELWEQWVGSTAPPLEHRRPRARVTTRDGRKWITCPDELGGKKVIIEMPDNAPTKSCDQARHDSCPHRLGGPAEGGILFKYNFVWRCGCPCHRDPHRVGRLF